MSHCDRGVFAKWMGRVTLWLIHKVLLWDMTTWLSVRHDSLWDMTHCETWLVVRHDPLWDMTHCETWLIHTGLLWDTTHLYSSHTSVPMWHVPFNVTCPFHTWQRPLSQCDMTLSYFKDSSVTVRHASYILSTHLCPSATWLIHNAHKIISWCDMVHSQCNEDSFVMIYKLSHNATLIQNTMGIVIHSAVNMHS